MIPLPKFLSTILPMCEPWFIILPISFSGFESYDLINVIDTPLSIESMSEYKKKNLSQDFIYSAVGSDPVQNECQVALISCSSNPGGDPGRLSPDQAVPWLAQIFVDGLFRCLASIVADNWLLAHASCIPNHSE